MPSAHLRLLVDPPGDGAWNMAVDEALLEIAARSGVATIRFYQWSQPTLSLGYFQSYAERHSHPASLECTCVRRVSGGGAILHDAELTYSLTLPANHPLAGSWQSLGRAIHETLAEALSPLSGGLLQVCTDPAHRPHGPFLCFQRIARGDLLYDAVKIAGSAQRRRKGALLQHGSVLLRRSPAAPELAGWADLAGVALGVSELADRWLPTLERCLGERAIDGGLSRSEEKCAATLVNSKHGSIHWTQRR